MPFPKPVLWFSSNIILSPLDVVRKHLLQPHCGVSLLTCGFRSLPGIASALKISWENMELFM